MEIKLWNKESDYPVLCRWWEQYNWEPVSDVLLPTDGYIASQHNEKLAAGFVYFTNNAPLAYADWFITNPNAGAKSKHLALQKVFQKIEEESIKKGCKIITSSVASHSLIKRMTKYHNYEIAGHNIMQLIRILDTEEVGSIDYFRDQEAIEKYSPDDIRKEQNFKHLSEEQKDILNKIKNDDI